MKKILFVLSLAIAALACSHNKIVNGVPNLVQVRSNVWRAGQPTVEGWRYLVQVFGPKTVHVIKLDFESEGSDAYAASLGFDVHSLGIDPRTNPDGLTTAVEEVFKRPTAITWREVVRLIGTIPSVDDGRQVWLFHCVNGHDRTGLAIGHVRVIVDGWTKKEAWKEMLAHGYHSELIGLDEEWRLFKSSRK